MPSKSNGVKSKPALAREGWGAEGDSGGPLLGCEGESGWGRRLAELRDGRDQASRPEHPDRLLLGPSVEGPSLGRGPFRRYLGPRPAPAPAHIQTHLGQGHADLPPGLENGEKARGVEAPDGVPTHPHRL